MCGEHAEEDREWFKKAALQTAKTSLRGGTRESGEDKGLKAWKGKEA